jgi:SAM-dependent methyltransferase
MQLPDPLPRNLNLGCGYDYRPGFLNVDSDPACGPDLIADVASLPMLPSGHFDHIVAHDVLEHISRTKTDDVLEEWARLLAPTGHMFVRVPSLQHLAALSLADGYQDADHAAGIIHLLFGTQAQTGDYHLTSFTRATLVRHFARVGLHVVSVALMDGWMYDLEVSRTPAVEPAVWPAVASLADAVPDVSAQLAAMRQSTSWRITAPLRAVRRRWR